MTSGNRLCCAAEVSLKNAYARRGDKGFGEYGGMTGFCTSASLDEIREHHHVLTPGRYVGAEDLEDDDEPFEEKMARLTATLDVVLPTDAGKDLRLRTVSRPEKHMAILLDKLQLPLPNKPKAIKM
jgi:hypothetical protein